MMDIFPREIGIPKRKVIYNWEEMKNTIDKYNGKSNLFTTIYGFKKIKTKIFYGGFKYIICDYDTAKVDKLFFDFANDNSYKNIIKSHNILTKQKIRHCINFSGRKYHLYVFVKNAHKCMYLDDAVYNAQVDLCKQFNFTYGKEEHNKKNNPDIDSKLMGNLAGLCRIPNTYNLSGKKFCIMLNKKILISGHNNIQKMAETQQYLKNTFFGNEYLDLKQYDKQRIDVFNEETNFGKDIPKIKGKHEIGEEHFYPCVHKMITDGGYANVFNVAIWLKDKGYIYREADLIFKKYLKGKFRRTPGYGDDWKHSHIHDRTLETVYNDKSDKYLFPNCSLIWQEGNCLGRCHAFNKHYFSRKKKNEKTM